MRALYVGRFQPLHIGHIKVIKDALKEVDRLIVGIGSAEMNFMSDNPFTGSERYQMIEKALLDEKIPLEKYCIAPVRNIHNYALWVDHLALYLPPFDVVYTGSPIVKQLFELSSRDYKIRDITKSIKASSTEIRKRILNDDESWKKLVPESVSEFIEEIDGTYRIKHLGTK